MIAKTLGCARVVFNDAIRCREDAYAEGVKLSDSEIQSRVTAQAKRTPEREWLADVSSIALIQACNDARHAYRNWWDSLSGKRKGRKVGRPRFKSRKDRRQVFRLTRNHFVIRTNGLLHLEKVGDVEVRWSRILPSVPSSVAVIREPDGRYYAVFVVKREDSPFRLVDAEAGIDLGLTRFLTASDGTIIANPRWLRKRARKLAQAQRILSRRQKGSRRRERARRRVAILHRRVRETRTDFHHKVALSLLRDNQAVHVESLGIAGLAKTRMARSVNDVGWSSFLRILEYKAQRHHREVVRIGRFYPSSQLCSACGLRDGPKPLDIRRWTCFGCGISHDRDINAARNILAAGQAERLNARGADVRPERDPAICSETRTHRGAADAVRQGSLPLWDDVDVKSRVPSRTREHAVGFREPVQP